MFTRNVAFLCGSHYAEVKITFSTPRTHDQPCKCLADRKYILYIGSYEHRHGIAEYATAPAVQPIRAPLFPGEEKDTHVHEKEEKKKRRKFVRVHEIHEIHEIHQSVDRYLNNQ